MNKKIRNSVIIEKETVKKKKNKEVLELYDYLKTRNFENIPNIIQVDDEYITYEKIKEEKYHEKTKGIELIKTLSLLHYKTLFFKDVSKNKYRDVYEKINNNIEYLKEYYETLISEIELEKYMSPSHYLFARNYSVILNSINYATKELKNWFKIVENKSKERVCVVHNNVSFDHFIKGDKNYLISFEKHLVDSPVIDLYKFYKKEGHKLDFNLLLEEYNNELKLLPEETKLLNILISLPPKLIEVDNEYLNTIEVNNLFEYIYNGINIVNAKK